MGRYSTSWLRVRTILCAWMILAGVAGKAISGDEVGKTKELAGMSVWVEMPVGGSPGMLNVWFNKMGDDLPIRYADVRLEVFDKDGGRIAMARAYPDVQVFGGATTFVSESVSGSYVLKPALGQEPEKIVVWWKGEKVEFGRSEISRTEPLDESKFPFAPGGR